MEHSINTLVLASSSPYRKEQLAKLGLTFLALSPDIDETRQPAETPFELVERLSLRKAREVQKVHPNSIIIGSDQVAYIKEEDQDLKKVSVLSKPMTIENAHLQLLACSGKTVSFVTGLCCLGPKQPERIISETVNVTFRELTLTEIQRYVELEKPLDCAGSFKAEGLGIALFDKIESSDPSTLIGLPLIALNKMLIKLGVNALLP